VLWGRSDDGIGYLVIAAWSKDLDFPAIEQALAALRDCKAMVIDARPNCGGDEALAQRVAAWFVDGRKVYAKQRVRVKAGRYGFGPVTTRALSGNSDRRQRFLGPIAVLTSRYVMGANESFVMMLQQAASCTVVGQPTWGSSGSPKLFELGNGTAALVPTVQDQRPDGTGIEGEGIAPDVLVECSADDLLDGDPILAKALELLRRKVAR
jgi:C-terminal processing protease CtpA/Prc